MRATKTAGLVGMLAGLAAWAAAPAAPKTGGAWMEASLATKLEAGTLLEKDWVTAVPPHAVFASDGGVTLEYGQDGETFAWRLRGEALELQRSGAWTPVPWKIAEGGAVRSTLLGRDTVLKWVKESPTDYFARRRAETSAGLRKGVLGTWRGVGRELVVTPGAATLDGAAATVELMRCLEACTEGRWKVCGVARAGAAQFEFVLEDKHLTEVDVGPALCPLGTAFDRVEKPRVLEPAPQAR